MANKMYGIDFDRILWSSFRDSYLQQPKERTLRIQMSVKDRTKEGKPSRSSKYLDTFFALSSKIEVYQQPVSSR